MIHLYTEQQALQALERCDGEIGRICAECSLPPACLKSVLMMELTRMDILDPLADTVVAVNWLGAPLLGSSPNTDSPLQKLDSSTGYGQIFSRVAIEAILFAREHGIPCAVLQDLPPALSPDNPGDLRLVWHRLRRDRVFNLSCAALNLLHCAWQMTGRLAFESYSPQEMKLIFTRYNADVKQITRYGEEAYAWYLRFSS